MRPTTRNRSSPTGCSGARQLRARTARKTLSVGCPPSRPCLRCRHVYRVPQVLETPKDTILSVHVEARLVDLDGASSPTDGDLPERPWSVTGGLRLPYGAAGSRR